MAVRLARLAPVALLVWLLVVAVHLTVGIGARGLADPGWKVAYNGLIFASAVVCLIGAPRGERHVWSLIAAALVAWAAGNTYWTFFLVDLDSPPYPSVSDVFWLAFYPPVYLALALLLRRRVRAYRASLALDGAIGALAVGAVATALVFGKVAETDAGSPLGNLTNLAYPLADMLLVAMVAGALALTGWRADRAWAYLAVGFVVFGASDSLYLFQVAEGSYHEGTLVDLGWPAAAVLLAFAASQRRTNRVAERRSGWLLLGLPALFAAVGFSVLVFDHFGSGSPCWRSASPPRRPGGDRRMALTSARTSRCCRADRRGETDPLTGLGNRRKLTRHSRPRPSAKPPAACCSST